MLSQLTLMSPVAAMDGWMDEWMVGGWTGKHFSIGFQLHS